MPGSDTKTPSCPHLGRSTAGKKYLQRQAPMFTCMRRIAHLVRGVFLYKMQLQQVSGCWYSWSDKKKKICHKNHKWQVTGPGADIQQRNPTWDEFSVQFELLVKSKKKTFDFLVFALLIFQLKKSHQSYFHHHHLLYMIVIKIVPQHKDDFTDNRSDFNVRLERVWCRRLQQHLQLPQVRVHLEQ